jgi:hypothetical protein
VTNAIILLKVGKDRINEVAESTTIVLIGSAVPAAA